MKQSLSTVTLLLLLACSREPQVTPENLISIEYGTLLGFTGWVTTVTVYPQKQVFKPSYQSAKTCETTVSTAEWNELARLVDATALRKVKVAEERTCPDAGASWIIARSNTGEVKALWGPCTGGDPTGIQPLISALSKRMSAHQAICK
jgi:hypothetical protein